MIWVFEDAGRIVTLVLSLAVDVTWTTFGVRIRGIS